MRTSDVGVAGVILSDPMSFGAGRQQGITTGPDIKLSSTSTS